MCIFESQIAFEHSQSDFVYQGRSFCQKNSMPELKTLRNVKPLFAVLNENYDSYCGRMIVVHSGTSMGTS